LCEGWWCLCAAFSGLAEDVPEIREFGLLPEVVHHFFGCEFLDHEHIVDRLKEIARESEREVGAKR
jgi:hypothetical protein